MARRTPNTSRAKDSPAGAKAQAAAEAVVAAEASEGTSAPHTEGATDAGNTAEAPIAAPDVTGQEQPGGGVDGDAGVPAGDTPAPVSEVAPAAPENPQPATDAAAAASGDGGQASDAERAALAQAIESLGGSPAAIIPKGADIEFLPLTPPPTGMVVKVTGPKKGRRRAGRTFGREPVLIPAEELTEDELTALMADPALIVELV